MGDRIVGSNLINPDDNGSGTTQPLAVKMIDGMTRFNRRTRYQEHPFVARLRKPGNLLIVSKPSIPGGERCDAAHDYIGGAISESNSREMYQVFRPKSDTLTGLTLAARITTETTILEDCDGPGIPFQDEEGGALSIDATKSVDGGSSLKIVPAGSNMFVADIGWYDAGLGAGVWRGGDTAWQGAGFTEVELKATRWKGDTNPAEPGTPYTFNLEFDPTQGTYGSFRVNSGEWNAILANDGGGSPYIDGLCQMALEDSDSDFVLYMTVSELPSGANTEVVQVNQFSRGINFEDAHGLHFFVRADDSLAPLGIMSLVPSVVTFGDCFGTEFSVPFEPYQAGWNEIIIRVSDMMIAAVAGVETDTGEHEVGSDDPFSIGTAPVFAWSNVTDINFKFTNGQFIGDIHLDAIGLMPGNGPENMSSILQGVVVELYDFGATFPAHLAMPGGFGIGDGSRVFPDGCESAEVASYAGLAYGRYENQLLAFPNFKFGITDEENTLTPDNYYVLKIRYPDGEILFPSESALIQMLGSNDGEDRYASGRALTSNDSGVTFEEVGGGDPAELYFNYRELADVFVDDIIMGDSIPLSRMIAMYEGGEFQPGVTPSDELSDQRNASVLSGDPCHIRCLLKDGDGNILVEVQNDFQDFYNSGLLQMLGQNLTSDQNALIAKLASGEMIPASLMVQLFITKSVGDIQAALANKNATLPKVTKGGGLEFHVSANGSTVGAFFYALGESGPEGRLVNFKWTLFHEAAEKNG